MTLQITTPTGITKFVTVSNERDVAYFMKWKERGYEVREIRVFKAPSEECEACSS
jgi:hypothetical protein